MNSNTQIYVNQPATICFFTDREPVKVVSVSKDKKSAIVRRLDTRWDSNTKQFIVLDSFMREQSQLPKNPDNRTCFKIVKIKNDWFTSENHNPVILGKSKKYYDYSF